MTPSLRLRAAAVAAALLTPLAVTATATAATPDGALEVAGHSARHLAGHRPLVTRHLVGCSYRGTTTAHGDTGRFRVTRAVVVHLGDTRSGESVYTTGPTASHPVGDLTATGPVRHTTLRGRVVTAVTAPVLGARTPAPVAQTVHVDVRHIHRAVAVRVPSVPYAACAGWRAPTLVVPRLSEVAVTGCDVTHPSFTVTGDPVADVRVGWSGTLTGGRYTFGPDVAPAAEQVTVGGSWDTQWVGQHLVPGPAQVSVDLWPLDAEPGQPAAAHISVPAPAVTADVCDPAATMGSPVGVDAFVAPAAEPTDLPAGEQVVDLGPVLGADGITRERYSVPMAARLTGGVFDSEHRGRYTAHTDGAPVEVTFETVIDVNPAEDGTSTDYAIDGLNVYRFNTATQAMEPVWVDFPVPVLVSLP